MNLRLTRLLGSLLLCALGCVMATGHLSAQTSTNAAPTPNPGAPRTPYYLTGKENVWSSFPTKPLLGSAVDQSDLVITLSIQATRNDAQKTEAIHDQHYSINLVNEFIAPDFAAKYPNTCQVLMNADQDVYFITSMLKKSNARLRPYDQHPTLVQPLFTSSDFTYPSGHASGSQLQARILGTIFPAQAKGLLNRARQIADSRVVAGVHYASDTEYGQALGDLVFAQLESNPRFKAELAAAAQKDHIP